jgi:hypothetical protein
MAKSILKLTGVLLLVAVAFFWGANQDRIRQWLAGQPYLQGIAKHLGKEAAQDTTEWVEKLRKGGYILFFRHANRDKWPEVTAFDLYEIATKIEDASNTTFKKAVCLSDQGIEEAKIIGKIFQLARIPTGYIVTSPSCRARQTATHAFGRYDAVDVSIRFAGLVGDKAFGGSQERLLTLLRTVRINPGTNTVISGHGINLGPNGVGGVEGDFPGGNSAGLLETGFYVIERRGDGTLRLVAAFKSISDLARPAIKIPLG